MSRRIGKWSGGEDSSGVFNPVGTVVLLLVGGFLGSGDFCDAGEFRFRPKLPVWLKPTRTADQPAKQSTEKEQGPNSWERRPARRWQACYRRCVFAEFSARSRKTVG